MTARSRAGFAVPRRLRVRLPERLVEGGRGASLGDSLAMAGEGRRRREKRLLHLDDRHRWHDPDEAEEEQEEPGEAGGRDGRVDDARDEESPDLVAFLRQL
jgi:hypothetical protein